MNPASDDNGDPRILGAAVASLAGVILTVALVLFLEVLYYDSEEAQLQDKVYSQPVEALVRVRTQQEEELHSYRWVDREKGVVAIPIERAIQLVVGEAGADKSGGEKR